MDYDQESDEADFLEPLLSASHRPLRLRLGAEGGVAAPQLLPQRIDGTEGVCEGIELRIYCVALDAQIALKTFIGVAAELQIVTDRGELRSICGVVTEARQGESDGGLASYLLVLRDALAILDLSTCTRVFLNQSELEVVLTVLNEVRHTNPALAAAFEFEVDAAIGQSPDPARQQIIQCNEGTGAFIRRLLRRRGIGWVFRAGRSATSGADQATEGAAMPVHTLVLFRDARQLPPSRAGRIRFHRHGATEQRDTITAWCGVRTLRPGRVTRFSWDYTTPRSSSFMTTSACSTVDQGEKGGRLAAALDNYVVEAPHIRDSYDDLCALAQQAMARSDFEAKCYYAEGNVRDCGAGEYFGLDGHPDVDGHPDEERDFIILNLHITAQNNLPKQVDARIERLFKRNHWQIAEVRNEAIQGLLDGDLRVRIGMTCVRRDVRFAPAYDARTELPATPLQSAMVVGPSGEAVHCDQHGRVKVRFGGMRAQDHTHADAAGASDTDRDSAWVRVASGWAGTVAGDGQHFGALGLPRPGTEVLLAFLGGDPDKPVIIGQLYNSLARPPQLGLDNLPGNRYLTGIKSREIHGQRANQLRLDDTPEQISAQLASDHGHSELNLGWLTAPRSQGTGVPRGEGAELRTDHQLALRAGAGMLLSAWERMDDKQLERDDYLALMEECVALFRKLGQHAAASMAQAVDEQPQTALQSALKQWESGSNTAPRGTDGGAAVIGITAPEGISFATSKAIVSYAATNLDAVAGRHLQMTAGQRFSVNAEQGISLFSQQQGITAIAQQGKVLLQSQHGELAINASDDLQLTSSHGRLLGMAKEIVLISKSGSFIKLNDGITLGTTGKMVCNASSFEFRGPQSIAVALPEFRDADPVERHVLRDDPEYALESSFALEQLQRFARDASKAEFIAVLLPLFGYDIAAATYVRLYDALREDSLPNPKILLTKGGNHAASFDNDSMEIRVRLKAALAASKDKQAAWELMTMLLHEFGHYIDAMLRTKLYEEEDGEAPGRDASDDEGAKLAYALAHFDLENSTETPFATLTSPDYSGELTVVYAEAREAILKSQDEHAQKIEEKQGNEEFFPAKGEHADEHPDTSFGHASFVTVLRKLDEDFYSDSIAMQIRFGNWLRDYSQILDPSIVRKQGEKRDLPRFLSRAGWTKIIAIRARIEFERDKAELKGLFTVTPALLGVYRAVEHIDNPTNNQPNTSDPRSIDADFEAPPTPAQLAVDPATSMKCYIAQSKNFMRSKLDQAANAGRTTEGARHFGAALHVLEDYFAHSNFVELSLRKVGYTKVLPWTSKAKCKQEYPVVTGMFGSLDVIASVAGIIAESLVPKPELGYKKPKPHERTANDLTTLILLDEFGDQNWLKKYREWLAIRDVIQDNSAYQAFDYAKHAMKLLELEKNIEQFVVNGFIHLVGNSVDDAQIYLNGDPNTNGSTDPSHSQLAKDHDDHPFHTLAGLLAAEAVRTVGKEMKRRWQGNASADPGLAAAKFIVHPYESHWQDNIVLDWAKTHQAHIKRGESATALKALQEGHIKEAKSKLQALSLDATKMWNYFSKNLNIIFDENNQVEPWTN